MCVCEGGGLDILQKTAGPSHSGNVSSRNFVMERETQKSYKTYISEGCLLNSHKERSSLRYLNYSAC